MVVLAATVRAGMVVPPPRASTLPAAATRPIRVLSMGWGVQTWTLAAMAALDEIEKPDYVVFADTTHEIEGTTLFASTWGPWLEDHGLRVVASSSSKTDVSSATSSVWIPAFTLSAEGAEGQLNRQCTQNWKVRVVRAFCRAELARRGIDGLPPGSVEMWMGISLDEIERMRDSDVKYIANRYPLIERRITRQQCEEWLLTHHLPIPPKSSCTFCPYRSPVGWQSIKRRGGPDWDKAVAVDTAIRDRRHNGHVLFLHPARKPLAEAVVIPEDFGMSQVEMFDEGAMGCDGGICGV